MQGAKVLLRVHSAVLSVNTIIFFDRYICGLTGDTEPVLPKHCSKTTYRNVELSLIIFSSSALNIRDWSASHPSRFTPGNEPLCRLNSVVCTPNYSNNTLKLAKLAELYRYLIRNERLFLRRGIGYACFPFLYRMGLGTSSNWKKLQNHQDVCNFYNFPLFKVPYKNENHIIRISRSDVISCWYNHVVCLSHA